MGRKFTAGWNPHSISHITWNLLKAVFYPDVDVKASPLPVGSNATKDDLFNWSCCKTRWVSLVLTSLSTANGISNRLRTQSPHLILKTNERIKRCQSGATLKLSPFHFTLLVHMLFAHCNAPHRRLSEELNKPLEVIRNRKTVTRLENSTKAITEKCCSDLPLNCNYRKAVL